MHGNALMPWNIFSWLKLHNAPELCVCVCVWWRSVYFRGINSSTRKEWRGRDTSHLGRARSSTGSVCMCDQGWPAASPVYSYEGCEFSMSVRVGSLWTRWAPRPKSTPRWPCLHLGQSHVQEGKYGALWSPGRPHTFQSSWDEAFWLASTPFPWPQSFLQSPQGENIQGSQTSKEGLKQKK